MKSALTFLSGVGFGAGLMYLLDPREGQHRRSTLRDRLGNATNLRDPIEIRKSIELAGPVERVFPFFARYDSFPRFMANLHEVKNLGGGRSHWIAEGPAHMTVSWDAKVTRFEPNRIIAWQSEPGSTIENSGTLQFEPTQDGGTRVDIRLRYRPPAGGLGHLAAWMFGSDPSSMMDEDLVRLKALIEEGATTLPGKGEVSRQEVTQGAAVPAM